MSSNGHDTNGSNGHQHGNGHHANDAQPMLKRPLRKNIALAIDGGGIRGVVAARALMALEKALGQPVSQVANLVAGTSTGAIILGAVAMGMDATTIHDLYLDWGPRIFYKSWRTIPPLKYTVRYRYDGKTLHHILKEKWGDITLGDLNQQRPNFHMVLTSTDILANHPHDQIIQAALLELDAA
jgi:patatin-like phospholipase/acyl hydrolase